MCVYVRLFCYQLWLSTKQFKHIYIYILILGFSGLIAGVQSACHEFYGLNAFRA